MKLPYFTLVDKSLRHQVVFFQTTNSTHKVQISCNCQARPYGSYVPMGSSASLEESREIYNNPANHALPFGEEDLAKW